MQQAATPFHLALRQAVVGQGMTLDVLHRRLAEVGVRVSVSSLSNWQRGLSQPDRRNPGVVQALEKVLDVAEGSLASTLGPPRARGPRRQSEHDKSLWGAERLRLELGAPPQNPFDIVSDTEELTIGPGLGQWELRNQLQLVAREPRADLWLAFYFEDEGALPSVRGGPLTVVDKVITDPAIESVAALLRPVRPVARGESYPLEYYLTCESGGAPQSYHGKWLPPGTASISITVRFLGEQSATRAWQIFQRDQTSPVVDVIELPLIGPQAVHLSVRDPEPGFHGLRWVSG